MSLGGLRKLPAGSPRGYAEEERVCAKTHEPAPDVAVPTEVRFDHHEQSESERKVERYCFAVAADACHAAALVVDLSGDETPPGLKQHP